MLEFIYIPLVIGIITLGIYKLFELFVRKKERLTIIEKIGNKLQPSSLLDSDLLISSLPKFRGVSFITLRIACLLLGLGIGLLVGFFISQSFDYTGINQSNAYGLRELIYGASVLVFGGLGLLITFLIELRIENNRSREN